jgi:hypothetical protein
MPAGRPSDSARRRRKSDQNDETRGRLEAATAARHGRPTYTQGLATSDCLRMDLVLVQPSANNRLILYF